jgi:hypothetical protein
MNMNRTALLAAAKEVIAQDRQDTYGDAEEGFKEIAGAWAWYLGRPITARDVAQMMVLLKMARGKFNPGHADTAIDQIGYSALAGEIALK